MGCADKIHIAVAFLRFSGLTLSLEELSVFLKHGGRLRILVSTHLNVTQPEALHVLAGLEGVDLRLQHDLQGFHAKHYMFRQGGAVRTCWMGSSNFTKNGLYTSVEWNTGVNPKRRTIRQVTSRLDDSGQRSVADNFSLSRSWS